MKEWRHDRIISALLSISIASEALMLGACRLAHLSVGLSVRKVYCGKTADWIRMPFGMVSGVSQGMGVLDMGGDRRRERGGFGSEFGTSHCNQWGLFDALFSNYFEDLFSLLRCMRRYLLKDKFARHTGYNEVGELNNIIIVYPQATAIIDNPLGCWDWWGYTVKFYRK